MLIENPKINQWHSFLSGLDLRLKAASEQLKIALGESDGQNKNVPTSLSKISNKDLSLSKNQEEELRSNVSKLQDMIQKVTKLAELDVSPEQLTQIKTQLTSRKPEEGIESGIPGRMGLLVFNSTLIMLQLIDSIVLKINAPEEYRTQLSKLLTENCKNGNEFGLARNSGDLGKMLHMTTKEKELQHKLLALTNSWPLEFCGRCCVEEYTIGRDCGRPMLSQADNNGQRHA
jgi:hypothetical protein